MSFENWICYRTVSSAYHTLGIWSTPFTFTPEIAFSQKVISGVKIWKRILLKGNSENKLNNIGYSAYACLVLYRFWFCNIDFIFLHNYCLSLATRAKPSRCLQSREKCSSADDILTLTRETSFLEPMSLRNTNLLQFLLHIFWTV